MKKHYCLNRISRIEISSYSFMMGMKNWIRLKESYFDDLIVF